MIKIVIALSLAAAVFTQAPAVWGGDHVELQIAEKNATVEFDCAHGTIDGALSPDSNGQFKIAGTFTPEHAGPVREDTSQTRPATYAGTVKRGKDTDVMTLRITFTGQDAPPPMTFELVRGQAGNVRKCR